MKEPMTQLNHMNSTVKKNICILHIILGLWTVKRWIIEYKPIIRIIFKPDVGEGTMLNVF